MKNRVNISVADLITSHLVELVHVDSRCCYQLFHNLQVAVPEQIQIAILVKDHIEWWSLTCPHESNPPTITKRQTKIILTRRPTWEQSSRRTPSSWLLFLGSQGGPQSRLCDLMQHHHHYSHCHSLIMHICHHQQLSSIWQPLQAATTRGVEEDMRPVRFYKKC